LTEEILKFLVGIGLPVRMAELPGPTFLPGIHVESGVLVVDRERLLYPGDLLHEAGHLALKDPVSRAAANGDTGDDGGEELAAIAWSYAAALHIGIDPAVVFHPDGYRRGSMAILENFAAGRFVGVPFLQWMGLTCEEKRAKELGVAPFPHMVRWLRE
jgi:hypothetical protein